MERGRWRVPEDLCPSSELYRARFGSSRLVLFIRDIPDVCGSALLSRRMLPSRANATRSRKMNCINSEDFSNPDLKSVRSF